MRLRMSHDGCVAAIEVLGFVAGLACVWLYVRENPLAWASFERAQ